MYFHHRYKVHFFKKKIEDDVINHAQKVLINNQKNSNRILSTLKQNMLKEAQIGTPVSF